MVGAVELSDDHVIDDETLAQWRRWERSLEQERIRWAKKSPSAARSLISGRQAVAADPALLENSLGESAESALGPRRPGQPLQIGGNIRSIPAGAERVAERRGEADRGAVRPESGEPAPFGPETHQREMLPRPPGGSRGKTSPTLGGS